MEDEPWWHGADSTGQPGTGDSKSNGTGPQEAAKLFGAIRDRVLADPAAMKAAMQAMDVLSNFRTAAANPVAPGDAPECAYCPICQGISRAQHINPESVENLTAAAIRFADALMQTVSGEATDNPESPVRHVPLDDEDESGEPITHSEPPEQAGPNGDPGSANEKSGQASGETDG